MKPAPNVFRTPADVYLDYGLTLKQMERAILISALRRHQWIQKDAAKTLGISPRVMTYKVVIHGIEPPEGLRHRWRTRVPGATVDMIRDELVKSQA